MPNKIDGSFLLLSEGSADKKFLEALTAHWLPEFSFAFPFPNDKFYAVSAFHKMLSAVRVDEVWQENGRGIILIVDSCDSPQRTFNAVISELRLAEGYGMPAREGEIAFSGTGEPPVAVLTIPEGNAGGLESLYYDEMANRLPSLAANVSTFLASTPSDVSNWNAEKQAKARFAALVATSHRDDPSRAASAAYRRPPTIHIGSNIFRPLAERVRGLCLAMLEHAAAPPPNSV